MCAKKMHGYGGHGREWRERGRTVEHQQGAQARIESAQAKRLRYHQRKFEQMGNFIDESLRPVTSKAIQTLQAQINAKRNPLIKQQGYIRLLAIDAWHHEKAVNKAKELGIAHELDTEHFHAVSRENREGMWKTLLSPKIINGAQFIPRSPKELKEEIEKWKKRVPKMEHYS